MSFKCYFQVHLLIKCDRSNWWLNYSTSFHLKVVYFLLLSIPLSLIQQNLVPWVGLEPWAAHMIRALEDFLSLYGVFISKNFHIDLKITKQASFPLLRWTQLQVNIQDQHREALRRLHRLVQHARGGVHSRPTRRRPDGSPISGQFW